MSNRAATVSVIPGSHDPQRGESLPPWLEKKTKNNGDTYFVVHHYILAKYLLEKEIIYRDKHNFKYYSRQEGIWRDGAGDYLKQRIHEVLGQHTTITRTRETLEHIKNFTWRQNEEDIFDKQIYSLPLRNGTYYFKHDKEESKFIPDWNPLDYSTVNVNIDFDKDLVSEGDTLPVKTYAYLSNVLDKPEIDFLFEWLGFCLIKGYPLQKFLLLQGPGGNGKSVLINLLSEILGAKANVSNISLDTLQNEKFGRVHLYGKLMNGFADIDDSFFKSSSFIKALTGDDYIYAEFKGKDGFMFKNFAKLMFSANKLPSFKDRTEGMERRLIVLPMHKYPSKESFEELTTESILTDKKEMSRILLYAIESIEKVLERGSFSITERMETALKDWLENSDNVAMFVNEHCELDPSAKTTIKNLFREYDWYCKENNYIAIGKKHFTERIIDRYGLEKRKSGQVGYYFIGIRLLNDD